MDNTKCTVTLDQFKLFHGVDRQLFILLVKHLWRNPSECLQLIGLWLWLERVGVCSFIGKILSLPPFLIDELADEAVACLNCLSDHVPFPSETVEIPLTQSLMKRDISLQFFHEYRLTAYHEIQKLISQVCFPALADLFEDARNGTQMTTPYYGASSSSANQIRASSSSANSSLQSFSNLRFGGISVPFRGTLALAEETSVYDRTMFVTFSKGYAVTEHEVRRFFTRLLGNCIESLYMQEVGPDEQSLFAKVVFFTPAFINMILDGAPKAKFTINGKHVWMRKFVPKNSMQ